MSSNAAAKLTVRVERGRHEFRVVAQSPHGVPSLSLLARYAGGAEGVTLSVRHGSQHREFDQSAVAQHPALSAVLRLIADEVEYGKQKSGELLEYLCQCLLVYCTRLNVAVPRPHWGRVVRDPRIERAVELANRDIQKRWTVQLLARAVGLSRPVFARRFSAALGLSPMRYLTQRRMQVAAALLFACDSSLAEVAARVGYVSEFAFNRAFRRHYRVPPGEYRRHLPNSGPVAPRLAA